MNDPLKQRVLAKLAEIGPTYCSYIADELDITMPQAKEKLEALVKEGAAIRNGEWVGDIKIYKYTAN